MSCKPISSRFITIHLSKTSFNITIVQAYTPSTDYSNDVYKNSILWPITRDLGRDPQKDILVVQGDWNTKVEEDANTTWKGTCGHHNNAETNDGGLRLLAFANYNDFKLVYTYKASRRWPWHSSNGEHYNQIDNIMVKVLSVKCEHRQNL